MITVIVLAGIFLAVIVTAEYFDWRDVQQRLAAEREAQAIRDNHLWRLNDDLG